MKKLAILATQLLGLILALLSLNACSTPLPEAGSKGQVLWDYKTGGPILYGPSVVEGLVYFGSDDNHIYALDADTGQFRWRYRTGGRVRTTPTVLDGVVFVGSDDGYSYALDAKTGDLRWRYEAGGQSMSRLAVGDGVVVGATHTLLNSYLYALDVRSGSLLWRIRSRLALGTYPVVERGLVYIETFVGGNRLYALDAATGAVLWQFRSSFEDKQSSGFRYGEKAPEVADSVVYFAAADDQLYALDAKTGEMLWNHQAEESICRCLAAEDGIVYLPAADKIYALAAETGELLWRYQTGQLTSHPVVADGLVHVSSNDGHSYALDARTGELRWKNLTGGSRKSAVADGLKYITGSSIHAYNADGGEFVWEFETGIGIEYIPNEDDSEVFFVSGSGYVYAMNTATGEPFWRFKEEDPTKFYASYHPVTANGEVYFGAHSSKLNGRIYALNAVSGEVNWSVDLDGQLLFSPVVVDNKVYVGTAVAVNALDAAAGEFLWQIPGVDDDPFYSIVVTAGSDVYLGTVRGHLLALSPTTGEVIWRNQIDSRSMVAFGKGVVYASAFPGLVTALDAESGDSLWRIQLPGKSRFSRAAMRNPGGLSSPIASSVATLGYLTRPVVGEGIVFVGSDSDDVFALDAATGQLRWQFQTGGAVRISPALLDGVLYVASDDGYVYALDAVTGRPVSHYVVNSGADLMVVLDGVVFVNTRGGWVFALAEPEE